MSIAFDGPNRVVTINAPSVQARTLYSRWLDWACDSGTAGYARFLDDGDLLTIISQQGAVTNSIAFVVLNGWSIQTVGSCNVIGGQFARADGSSPFVAAFGQDLLSFEGTAGSTTSDVTAIANAVWTHAVEGALTAEQVQRIILAALAGKRTGLGTATEQYFAQDGLTPRLTMTADEAGNGVPVINGQ